MNKKWKMFIISLLCMGVLFTGQMQLTYAEGNPSLSKIDKFIQNNMKNNHIPGMSVAITHRDKVIFTKGYGQTSDKQAVTADTPFAIASLSKAFTALAVMQLVDQGKIDLDKPVVTYIKNFKLADPRGMKITVRHLLQHTSGLTDKVNPDMTKEEQPKSLSETISQLQTISLENEPGKQYHYHNPNYQILARLVEKVSGEAFNIYLQRHLFQPLEMKNTINVSNTKELNRIENFSAGHYYLFGQPMKKAEPNWFIAGPAGMVSTANDMAKWLSMQMTNGKYKNDQIISSKGLEQTHSSVDPKIHYGMGWQLGQSEDGKKQLQHTGILWTYKAETVMLPDEGYGIVVLFNSGLNSFVDYTTFTRGIAAILTDQPLEEPFMDNQYWEILMVLVIFITITLGIRTLLRLKHWDAKRTQRPAWRTYTYLGLRLLPILLLLFLSQILTFVGGGRVVTWEGMYMMMPSVVIWLIIAAIMQVSILAARMYRLFRK